MNISDLDLQEFFTEYGSLVFPELRVVRGDFFRHRTKSVWRAVLITEQEGKQLLTDVDGQILGRFDRLVPLFVAAPSKVSNEVQDLLEQLSGLRSRAPKGAYEQAAHTLQALARSSQPPASAYLAIQNGKLGVVDPEGNVVVPIGYTQIQPFAFVHPGETGVFLCRKTGHQLNSMDVYDWKGNCIFQQIGNFLPREETLLTPPDSGAPVRKVKSLWVIRQALDHPFPEDPDFELLHETPQRYTLKELRNAGMEDDPLWLHGSTGQGLPAEPISPLAATIAAQIGCDTEEVLSRLCDYRNFRLERTPPEIRLAKATAYTPLKQLGLSTRALHCLVQGGMQLAWDVMDLSEEAISRLPRITDETLQEILQLRRALIKICR